MTKQKNKHFNQHSAAYREAERLVDFFRKQGIPDKATMAAFDMLVDLGDLDETAMTIALDHVLTFLHHELPEPTENSVINTVVVAIMNMIIEAKEEDNSDNYRKHNINNKKKGTKK